MILHQLKLELKECQYVYRMRMRQHERTNIRRLRDNVVVIMTLI